MTPLQEQDIFFLGDPDPTYGTRKGVNVSKLQSGRHQGEIRVNIWNFVKLSAETGYITPKKGGISLTVEEFNNLLRHSGWPTERIKQLRHENNHSLIEEIDNIQDFEELQKKLDAAKKSLCALSDPRPSSSETKRKRAHKE